MLVIVIALTICVLVIVVADRMLEKNRTEFFTACINVGGTPAFNGRHWECLK
ncbi:hypothetical protein UFOVP408_32 [uncultured Caudovirales phage]|uniref:Uncharacterized protein n=1 Tax=uncultured Caudovirales phage TaxID=2100421 RepID=A0A6J5M7X9_9CAUD|nr:hypothetical protein UFOVP356_3 [uncultured Caudovirales phage]CAB4140501.1 hypothetical protein UFOVP408_32 [uncultured Caudovirales phage]CAB4156939.1 hypothetical protein UFOVP676_41 [uncultured Caudovirales phage]